MMLTCLLFFLNLKNVQLLLMKRGGQVIYGGKLGQHSKVMVDYFQVLVLSLLFCCDIDTKMLVAQDNYYGKP